MKEDLPFLLPVEKNFVYVELVGAGLDQGVYQIYDDMALLDVIKLTGSPLPGNVMMDVAWSHPLSDGESLRIVRKGLKTSALQRRWMNASQRMALAIPLHPDRMSELDWQALPGVGTALAERIELNRQKYGDFGRLESLRRVEGIGRKRIESWKMFFREG